MNSVVDPNERQETRKLPVINVQPSADTFVIPLEMFRAILFEWPEFFDAEFVAFLNCIRACGGCQTRRCR